MTKSLKIAMNDLDLSHVWIAYPGKERYKIDEKITVLPLNTFQEEWDYK